MIAKINSPKAWSVGEWVAVIMLVGAIAGLLIGAGQWMSDQNSQLKSLVEATQGIKTIIDKSLSSQERKNESFQKTLTDHERRLIIQESRKQ